MRISVLALAAVLAGCQGSDEGGVDSASVDLISPGSYQVSWESTGGPVDVYTARRPGGARDEMRLVVDDDLDGKEVIQLKSQRRPYFYVVSGNGNGVWAAERVLPLQGGVNFRDLGGYETEDGRRVKWGKLYRSGSMAGLTPADYDYLSDLGIKVVCDLRTDDERESQPNEWVKAKNIDYWSRSYGMSDGELGKLLTGAATPEAMKSAMAQGYRGLPYEQAPAYREIFDRLAAGEVPLAFNCSAGKDRAGIGSALILTVLGVPRDTVVADYALSDKVIDFRKMLAGQASPEEQSSHPLAKMPPEVIAPLMASDPDYIRAAFAEIEKRNGSVREFLRTEVGVTDDEVASIREALLE